MTTIKLPYYSPDQPCPLPTEDEIDQASDITLAYGGRRIVELGQHLVVKYGKGVNLSEGENLLFVQKNSSIRVPQVCALYSNSQTGKNYIVMERIRGRTLLSLWPELNSFDKETIASSLRNYFQELRQLPSPRYYGSLGNRPLQDEIFWTKAPVPTINGPFTTQDALIEGMAQKYTHDGRTSYLADFFRRCLPQVLLDDVPVFTHGDFQRKNVMVQVMPHAIDDNNAQKFQITLLDWEKSGWYHRY